MSPSTTRMAFLALAMTLGACGGADGGSVPDSETAQPSTTGQVPDEGASTTVTTELDMIVAPDATGAYPTDLVVTCAGGPSFPVGALNDVSPIDETDPDGMLTAIAPFLESEEGQFWPQDGWQLLSEEDQRAILATLHDGRLAFMFLERDGEEWAWSGSSMEGDPCDLRYSVPEGLNTVDWRLDPSAPVPTPEGDQLHVLITERECVSGQAIGNRLVGPQVVMTETSVLVAFAAEPPPGDAFTCQGNPETPFTVQLDQPLGDREIVEGTSIGINLEDFLR